MLCAELSNGDESPQLCSPLKTNYRKCQLQSGFRRTANETVFESNTNSTIEKSLVGNKRGEDGDQRCRRMAFYLFHCHSLRQQKNSCGCFPNSSHSTHKCLKHSFGRQLNRVAPAKTAHVVTKHNIATNLNYGVTSAKSTFISVCWCCTTQTHINQAQTYPLRHVSQIKLLESGVQVLLTTAVTSPPSPSLRRPAPLLASHHGMFGFRQPQADTVFRQNRTRVATPTTKALCNNICFAFLVLTENVVTHKHPICLNNQTHTRSTWALNF